MVSPDNPFLLQLYCQYNAPPWALRKCRAPGLGAAWRLVRTRRQGEDVGSGLTG